MEKKDASSFIGIIGVLLVIIILYNSMFSSKAKMTKNLKDLADAKTFVSTEVDKEVLDYIYEQKGYKMMKKSEAKEYTKLGNVQVMGKNKNTINTFDLYLKGEDDYALLMRGVFMKVLK